jgi:hypothetical protein
MEEFLILPLRHGLRFQQQGVHMIDTPLPALNIEEWEHLVPGAHPSGVADTINKASQALQVLSGSTDLTAEQRSNAQIIAICAAAETELADAVAALGDRGDAFATEASRYLQTLEERVRAELAGTGSRPTFAASVAAGTAV